MGLDFKDTFLEQIEGVNGPLSIDVLSKQIALAVGVFLLAQSQARLAAKIKEGGGITNYLPGLLSFGYGKDSQIDEIPTKEKLKLIEIVVARLLDRLETAVNLAKRDYCTEKSDCERFNDIKEMDTHRRTRVKYTSALTLMTIAAVFVINGIAWDQNWVYFLLSTIAILTIAHTAYEYIWRESYADKPYREVNTSKIKESLEAAAQNFETNLNNELAGQLPREQQNGIYAVSAGVKNTFLQRYTPVIGKKPAEKLNQEFASVQECVFDKDELSNKVSDAGLTF